MFIISPTRGGYRGDVVNSGFRQGRQDAYRDYIDNYNFALRADAATNAENQMNVQRAANNYALQNQMRKGARNEAYNFITDSGKIDDALTATDINFVKNADLRNPETIQQLGESQATQVRATQNANENTAAYKANKAQSYVEQQPLEADARKAKLEENMTDSQRGNVQNLTGMDADRWLSTNGGELGYENFISNMIDDRVNSMVEEARQRGEVVDPVELKQQLDSDPEVVKEAYQEYLRQLSQARSQHAVSRGSMVDNEGNVENYRSSRSSNRTTGTSSTSAEKLGKPQQKAYKMGESFEAFKNATPHQYVSANTIRSGNTLYFANGQMITFPEGTDMEKVVKQYANYDMMNNVEPVNKKVSN